ncbi:MAG: permease prefix domain 1-containing protein [Blastocatellia bacterium]
MTKIRRIRSSLLRLVGLFERKRREHELTDELKSHLDMHIEDNIRRGMGPREARRVALIKLGGVDATKELYSDIIGLQMLENLLRDIRYATRTLRRTPGFSLVAIMTLALGIGANSSIFATANAIMWRPLPVANPRSLVLLSAPREDNEVEDYLPVALSDELRRNAACSLKSSLKPMMV